MLLVQSSIIFGQRKFVLLVAIWNIFGFTEKQSLNFGFPDQIQNQKSNYIKSGGLPTNNLVSDITKEICHVMSIKYFTKIVPRR